MIRQAACSDRCGLEPPTAHASGCGALVPRIEAALACSKDPRAEATMRVEPDGTEGQDEARRHFQPAPDWAAQDEESAWVIIRAELVGGLDHCEVGLGPKRVADGFMQIEAYEKRGDSYRDEDQMDEDLEDLVAGLEFLSAGAVKLQESLRKAMPQAAEGREFMHQVMELGINAGEGDELSLASRRRMPSEGGSPEACPAAPRLKRRATSLC